MKLKKIFLILVGILAQSCYASSCDKKNLLMPTGVAAGIAVSYSINALIDQSFKPSCTFLKLGARLSGNALVGLAIFLGGAKYGLIKVVRGRAVYHPLFNRWVTSFHVGYCAQDALRAFDLTQAPLNELSLDRLYGAVNFVSVIMNLQELCA